MNDPPSMETERRQPKIQSNFFSFQTYHINFHLLLANLTQKNPKKGIRLAVNKYSHIEKKQVDLTKVSTMICMVQNL